MADIASSSPHGIQCLQGVNVSGCPRQLLLHCSTTSHPCEYAGMTKYFCAKVSSKRTLIFGIFLLFIHNPTYANQFCFATAENYYEQVYCELAYKGQTKNLPSYDDFRKNDEAIQFTLLRRIAEKNKIDFPPPHKSTGIKTDATKVATKPAELKPVQQSSSNAPQTVITKTKIATVKESSNRTNCQLQANEINCGAQYYSLSSNKNNQQLADGVLQEEYKMALPVYTAGEPVNDYLTQAYRQYIDKMCAIGLCGVTMTYTKFAFFYHDLELKGLSFSKRFETMFSFLKKDKSTMNAGGKISAPMQLTINDCDALNDKRIVCDFKGTNYIFELR